jgi:glycosyltransferase involved in cell wall biosynthesis
MLEQTKWWLEEGMLMDDNLELSVVLPCLNEAKTIQVCVRKSLSQIKLLGIKGEVVVADNGSTDGSQGLARAAGARVVDVLERGYGSALRNGIEAAHGRWVIMADGDDSYALDDLKPFLDELAKDNQLVIGNRFLGGIADGAMPFLHRRIGNPVLSAVGRIFFKVPCRDFHCGMRAFDRKAVLSLDLRTSGMEFASEMLVRASMEGFRISEVPTTLSPDGRDRVPHLRTWRDGWRHLRFLLLYSPRWLFFYPGIFLSFFGALGVILLGTVATISLGAVQFGIQTQLLLAGALLVGQQLMWFAIIAKVVAVRNGLHRQDRRVDYWLSLLSVERCLLIGGSTIAVGLAGIFFSVSEWAKTSFGQLEPLSSMRLAVTYVAAMVIGTQTVFSGFLLSIVGIKRTTR